ncbi:MAG: carboxypeptidase regulatory-like domain-containing protein [Smithella sp.]
MNIGRISTPVLLSFFIIIFMTVIGCGNMQATSVISGTVTGALKEGITINLTGAATASTTTDASGNYSFNNVDNGNYTVTPYLDSYTFSPTSTAVTVNGASVTGINFASTHSGYGISGTVTGVVAANVTLTLNDLDSTTTTTNPNGNYTLRNTDIVNKTYIVKPYLVGYKFRPYTQSVPVAEASVTGINFVSYVAHLNSTTGTNTWDATGTYTWDSTMGTLTITWNTGTPGPCYWPQAGKEVETGVTIADTTMIWPDTIKWPDGIAWLGSMIWTRTSSTIVADDPAGVWTAYDQSGNEYTATFTPASGSISLNENIVACAYASSEIISGDYNVSLSYQDPQQAATSVSVTGTGISTPLSLTYDASYGEWNTASIDIGPTKTTTPPYTYTFNVIISAPDNERDERSCFVDSPTNLYTGWVALPPTLTFYWTGVADASGYVVQVKDSSYNLIWESAEVTEGSQADYEGSPILTSGGTYYFYVIVNGTSYCANGTSYAEASFTAP